jgi:hypothetical protein
MIGGDVRGSTNNRVVETAMMQSLPSRWIGGVPGNIYLRMYTMEAGRDATTVKYLSTPPMWSILSFMSFVVGVLTGIDVRLYR